MAPRAMDSLDLVQAVMLIEEIFETEIPDGDAEQFGSPRDIVDWLEPRLYNRRPNHRMAAALRKLAKNRDNPALAGVWTGPGEGSKLPRSFAKSSDKPLLPRRP